MRKWLLRAVLAGVVLLVVTQVIPYGRDHTNPPVTKEIAWDSPATRSLAVGACYDCHSTLTDWKWYSNVAPFSWLIYADVQGGRETLDFSTWDKPQGDGAGDVVDAVRGGSMPPLQYKPLHSGARLSAAQRDQLIAGLQRSLARDPPIGGGGG
jgi:hypothetical protein